MLFGLLAGASSALAIGFAAVPASAQELTIFWAEWDPANYLQELVNEYTEETGVTVTVETTPWSDFQTKAFTEFNAKGDAYDMVVGDSQWLGAGSTGGHYVDLTDLFKRAQGRRDHGAGHGQVLCRVRRQATGRSRPRATRPAGPTARTGSRIRPRWRRSRPSTATTSRVPKTYAETARHRRVLPPAGREPLRHRDLHRATPMTRWSWAYENALFSYGGDLGDYSTYQVDGIVNSDKAVAALEMYRELYQFTPPNWGKTFFQEDNQAITEGLAAMSMNYFAFFPALTNPAINPHARGHRLLRQPGRAGRAAARGAGRAGDLGRLLFAEPGRSR